MTLNTSRFTRLCAALVPLLALGFAANARAGFVVTFQEVGNDVVATGSGSLNLSALIYVSGVSVSPRVIPLSGGTSGTAMLGPAASADRWGQTGQVAGPSNFGTGGNTAATSAFGDTVSIRGQASAGLYIGGTSYANINNLSNTTTWANTTFSGLGITPGTYTWTWGSGASADFFTLNASTTVPEPSTIMLGLAGLAGLGIVTLKKKIRRC